VGLKDYFKLFITFAKIGALTFGGGYAMLPMLQRELVQNNSWATEEELLDYYAVGQCTPGIIAVNTATFVGMKLYGIPGAVVASLGIVFPSVVIIMLIASVLENFASIPAVKSAFAGIRVCVVVLILNSVIKLYKSAVKDKVGLVIFAGVLILSIFLDISPVIFVILSAAAGIFIKVKLVSGK